MNGSATRERYLSEIICAMQRLGLNPKEDDLILDAGVIYVLNDRPVSVPYDYTRIRVWYKFDVFGIWDTKRKTFVD